MPDNTYQCTIARRRLSSPYPLTQEQLAKLVGHDQGELSRIETGERLATLPLAIKLAQVLGVNIEALWPELAAKCREQVLVRMRKKGMLPGYNEQDAKTVTR